MSSQETAGAHAHDAMSLMRLGFGGSDGHDSTKEPFMLPVLDQTRVKTRCSTSPAQYRDEIETLFTRVPLPEELRALFRLIDRPMSEHVFGALSLIHI